MVGVDIHRAATAFDIVAHAYERGRPDYPRAAVDALVGALGIGPDSTVVDVAAGTGKLTRLLVERGARVIAVEPVAGMRAVLGDVVPEAEVIDGTAEDTGLRAGMADAVTVGQAFHWFRGAEALAEIRRVLRPGAGLGLVWNRRDLSQPLQAELDAVLDPHRGDTPSLASGAWRVAFERTDLFGSLEEAHVPMIQTLDRERLVDRMVSVSFVAGLPEAEREGVARSLRAVADRHPAPLELRYVTDVYWCRAR
jgi:SAM-dependent methyltransferase